jgi:membrane protein
VTDATGTEDRHRSNLVDFLKEIYEIWISERPNQLAAALAYFGLFSFAPVIYIALSIAGIFIDKSAVLDRFLARIEAALGPGISEAVQHLLNRVSVPASEGSWLISLISFLLLLLTASGVFYQLQYALNTVWKVPISKAGALQRTLRERLFSVLIVIGIGLLLVLATMISLVAQWISSISILPDLLPSLTFLGFIALAGLSFGVLYKLLPAIRIAWRDVWVGAVGAAFLVAIGGKVVIFFIGLTNFSSALEAAGAFIVLLTGFYYFAQMFLLGAIITRVYAHRYGSMRPEVPVDVVASVSAG